jgi:hypothetical protein
MNREITVAIFGVQFLLETITLVSSANKMGSDKVFIVQGRASYPMGTSGSFPGVKRPGREADHSTPSSASKNGWSYTSTPQYAFMAWYSTKAQGQPYLYLTSFTVTALSWGSPSTPGQATGSRLILP